MPIINPRNTEKVFKNLSAFRLMYTALMFRMCKSNFVVNMTLRCIKIPIVRIPVKHFIKTFIFRTFCAGESFAECLDRVTLLKECGVKSIVDHCVEECTNSAQWEVNAQHKLSIITSLNHGGIAAGNFVPVKCSALMDAKLLDKISLLIFKHCSRNDSSDQFILSLLDSEEKKSLEVGLQYLDSICTMASQNEVRLLLDAEQSYRQPGIEVVYRILARKHNKIENKYPILYNTYQCYLKRTEKWLKHDIHQANDGNYLLGIKLVRGAYMKSEADYRKLTPNADEIIWESKQLTDANYNNIMCNILSAMTTDSKLSIMIASHNRHSVETAVQYLAKNTSIPKSNVFFAQILGDYSVKSSCYIVVTLLF